jgi:hypothetical protein
MYGGETHKTLGRFCVSPETEKKHDFAHTAVKFFFDVAQRHNKLKSAIWTNQLSIAAKLFHLEQNGAFST